MQRKRKDCPVPGCCKTQLLRLANHLADVHGLSPDERKPWLQEAKCRFHKYSRTVNENSVVPHPLTMVDVRFKFPCSIVLSGPSGCGKSTFCERLLRHLDDMFDVKIEQIVYCYGEFQPRFLIMEQEIPNLTFYKGFPEHIYSLFEKTPGLIILDDLMSECSTSDTMMDLITKGSHHQNIACMRLTQNLYYGGKHSRTISLNTHYIVAFKNPRDSLGISTLARQAFPRAVPYVLESYEDATRLPYSYLLLDFHNSTPDSLRLRTSIFPDEQQVVYVKRT